MNRVKILPPEIVAKIAAGEVVERPASVVKELLENALDAAATSIEVTLADAGKALIKIKDNGCGIRHDDIPSLFNRHATSKIHLENDLLHIRSLGFRGEALYSIAAVSDIIIRTKPESQEHGWELQVRAGVHIARAPFPMTTGTEIEVKELFFNTPARKKFLKSNAAEIHQILDIVTRYTILYPLVRFSLIHDGKKLLELSPAAGLTNRIASALHLDTRHLIEESRDFPENELSLHLVLGDINIIRTRKDMQFIFVNGRPVENRTIGFCLNDVYRLLLNPGAYPFFCAYLTFPPYDVDVNVHPTKREVKIKNEAEVAAILRRYAEQLLMTRSKAKQYEKPIYTAGSSRETAPALHQQRLTTDFTQQGEFVLERNSAALPAEQVLYENRSRGLREKLLQSRYLGNWRNAYLLFETPDSLFVVDQHAAHERIRFEKLKNQIEAGTIEVQQLLSPVLVALSPQEILLWEENQEALEKVGFSCSLFDPRTLAIHAHPHLVEYPEECVRNLLAGEHVSRLTPEKLARLACHSSVRAGTPIKKEEAEYQRQQLLLCQDPFICPHGRPTVIEIPESSLRKQFLRS